MEGRKPKTLLLHRIVALPYNPYFEKEVKDIRRKYAIPEEKAWEWFQALLGEYRETAYSMFFPKFNLPWLNPALKTQKTENVMATGVPLEGEILVLLVRFGLPVTMYRTVVHYVVEDKKEWLHPVFLEPLVNCEFETITGVDMLNVTITRLAHWTTKKQWDDIWERYVKPKIKIAQQVLAEVYDIPAVGKKRATLSSLDEQIKRWSDWYELSETQGLGPVKALNKWEEDHPDEIDADKPIDPSTVTHAIQDFRDIITPITSTEDINF